MKFSRIPRSSPTALPILSRLAIFTLLAVLFLMAAAAAQAKAGQTKPDTARRPEVDQAASYHNSAGEEVAQNPDPASTPSAVTMNSIHVSAVRGRLPRAAILLVGAVLLQAAVLSAGQMRRKR